MRTITLTFREIMNLPEKALGYTYNAYVKGRLIHRYEDSLNIELTDGVYYYYLAEIDMRSGWAERTGEKIQFDPDTEYFELEIPDSFQEVRNDLLSIGEHSMRKYVLECEDAIDALESFINRKIAAEADTVEVEAPEIAQNQKNDDDDDYGDEDDEFSLSKKVYIPRVDDRIIEEMAKSIHPIITVDGKKRMIKPVDLFGVSYIWSPQPTFEISNLKELCRITTYHKWGHYVLFKPSVAEVLAQIPDEYLDAVVAFEIVESPETADDLNKHMDVVNDGYHVATTALYVLNEE